MIVKVGGKKQETGKADYFVHFGCVGLMVFTPATKVPLLASSAGQSLSGLRCY